MSKSEIRSIITLLKCIYKVPDNNLPGFSLRDIKMLVWCPVGPVLPHGEKVPLYPWLATPLAMHAFHLQASFDFISLFRPFEFWLL